MNPAIELQISTINLRNFEMSDVAEQV